MAITPIPNPSAPATANPVYGASPNPNLTTPSPYSTPATGNIMLGTGNALQQELLGGPAQFRSNVNTTSTKTPYAPVVGPLNSYITGTEALYGGGAPQISPAEQAGYNALTAAGAGPSAGYLNTAAGSGANIAGGSLMNINSNPYLQQIIGETGSQALQDVNKTFGGAGRTGSGLNEWFGAQGAAQAENQLLSNEYNTNVGATINAITGAPSNVNASMLYPEAQIAAGTEQTLRPFQLNQNLGGILAQLAQLGGTTNTQQQTQETALQQTGGILGQIMQGLATTGMSSAGI